MKRIEITSTELETISGIGKESKKPFSFNKQELWVHSDNQPYPEKSEIIVNDGQPPYAVGFYELHPDSIIVGRNGRLAVTPILVRLSDQKAPPAKMAKTG